MVSLFVVVLVGLCHLWPVHALPHVQRSEVKIVSVKSRQTTVYLETVCGRSPDVKDAKSVSDQMAQYLEGVANSGRLCGLDRKQPYYNLVTAGKYEANIYFTNRVPQLTQAAFDCRQLADDLKKVVKICTENNAQPFYARIWLVNCAAKQTEFQGDVPQPYKEGGVAIEFREKGFPSDGHPGLTDDTV